MVYMNVDNVENAGAEKTNTKEEPRKYKIEPGYGELIPDYWSLKNILEESIIAVRFKPDSIKERILRILEHYVGMYQKKFVGKGRNMENESDKKYFKDIIWDPRGDFFLKMFGYDHISDVDWDVLYKKIKPEIKSLDETIARGSLIASKIYSYQERFFKYIPNLKHTHPTEIYEEALQIAERYTGEKLWEDIIEHWKDRGKIFHDRPPEVSSKWGILGFLGVAGSLKLADVIENVYPQLCNEWGMKILKTISSDPQFIYEHQHLASHIIPAIPAIAGALCAVYLAKKKHDEEKKQLYDEFYSRESLLRDARKGLEYLKTFEKNYKIG